MLTCIEAGYETKAAKLVGGLFFFPSTSVKEKTVSPFLISGKTLNVTMSCICSRTFQLVE